MQNPLLFVPRSLNKKRKKENAKDDRTFSSTPKHTKLTDEVIVIDDMEKGPSSSRLDQRETFLDDPGVICVVRSEHGELLKQPKIVDVGRKDKPSHLLKKDFSNSESAKPKVNSQVKPGTKSENPLEICGIITVLSAVENQKDPPYKDIGCLSPRKHIAVYKRPSVKACNKQENRRVNIHQYEKVYSDVNWDPWYCNKQYRLNSGYSERCSEVSEYKRNYHMPEYYKKYSNLPEYYSEHFKEPEYQSEHAHEPKYSSKYSDRMENRENYSYTSELSYKSTYYHEQTKNSWYSSSYKVYESQKDNTSHSRADTERFYEDTDSCTLSQGRYFEDFSVNVSLTDLGTAQERTLFESNKNFRYKEFPFGYPREWEYTDFGSTHMNSPPIPGQLDFTIMSYNVLAQNLLEDNSYLYTGSRSYTLDWEYRKSQLLKEFKAYLPDIMCLQEVNINHYEDFFVPELEKLGYKGSYIKRTSDKMDGCATFYKTSVFTLDKSFPIHYKNPKGGDLLDRDNVALILKLIPKLSSSELGEGQPLTSKRLFISNTHLLFNPRRGDVKLAQLMMLLAELDKCSYFKKEKGRDSYYGLILCGDFNLEPQSDIYRLLAMGRLAYEGLNRRTLSGQDIAYRRSSGPYLSRNFLPSAVGINDNCQYCNVVNDRSKSFISLDKEDDIITNLQGSGLLTHQLQLLSAYTHRIRRFDYWEDEITTHHGQSSSTVDYIFYGVDSAEVAFIRDRVCVRNVQEGSLRLIGCYGLLSDSELDGMGSLPNKKFGSDHLCLIARFLLS